MAKEKRLFIPVTKCPEKNDPYYTLIKYGGYSHGILGKPSAWAGSALNNCVGNAWGETAKREGNPNCKIGCVKGTDYPDDAKDWLENSKAQGYEIGMKAELGATAVWTRKGTLGHLGVVNKVYKNDPVYEDGSWDSSESGYKTRPTWWSKHYNAKSHKNGYVFQGFVLPKYEYYIEPEQEFNVGDKVQITARGNSRPDGKGSASYGIGYKRYVIAYIEGAKYPYQIGLTSPTIRTTGYYTAEALKKI